jgi:RNA polymerase sigma factor (sigma-70 family)
LRAVIYFVTIGTALRGPCSKKKRGFWVVPSVNRGVTPQRRDRVDEEALVETYRRTIRPLYAFVSRRVGGDVGLAEDLVQDTWMRALDTWPARGLPDEPLAWLVRVARNTLVSHFRRMPPVPVDPAVLDLEAAAFSPDGPATASALAWGLARLRRAHADVLEAFYFDGKSVREIARERSLSERAVEGRLRRARARLKKKLSRILRPSAATRGRADEGETAHARKLNLADAFIDRLEWQSAPKRATPTPLGAGAAATRSRGWPHSRHGLMLVSWPSAAASSRGLSGNGTCSAISCCPPTTAGRTGHGARLGREAQLQTAEGGSVGVAPAARSSSPFQGGRRAQLRRFGFKSTRSEIRAGSRWTRCPRSSRAATVTGGGERPVRAQAALELGRRAVMRAPLRRGPGPGDRRRGLAGAIIELEAAVVALRGRSTSPELSEGEMDATLADLRVLSRGRPAPYAWAESPWRKQQAISAQGRDGDRSTHIGVAGRALRLRELELEMSKAEVDLAVIRAGLDADPLRVLPPPAGFSGVRRAAENRPRVMWQ